MTDLVERLRQASVYEERSADLSNLGDEAADEIERLREDSVIQFALCAEAADEIETLRARLRDAESALESIERALAAFPVVEVEP